MIDADIYAPVMALLPEDRQDRVNVNEAVRRYRDSRNNGCSGTGPYAAREAAYSASGVRPCDKCFMISTSTA